MTKINKTFILAMAFVALLGLALPVQAQYTPYQEKWTPPMMNTGTYILYDYDDDDVYEQFVGDGGLASSYFMFEEGDESNSDEVTGADWEVYFQCTESPYVEITLVDASYGTYSNSGTKETYCTCPRQQCEFEGSGTWCGYEATLGVYFWGNWTTEVSENPDNHYFFMCRESYPPYANAYLQFTVTASSDGNAYPVTREGGSYLTWVSATHPILSGYSCDNRWDCD